MLHTSSDVTRAAPSSAKSLLRNLNKAANQLVTVLNPSGGGKRHTRNTTKHAPTLACFVLHQPTEIANKLEHSLHDQQ